jgi:predicted metalloprotease with PDZ domain
MKLLPMKNVIYILALLPTLLFGQSVSYNLRMEKPQNHYFQVEMVLRDFSETDLLVKLPVWAPGSYLVREFSKNINQVKAVDENNNPLAVEKTAKNAWKIKKAKARIITVSYEVYAFELTVRTSFLDLSHGFVSGSGVFMYADGYKALGGSVTVFPYKSFATVTTPLKRSADDIDNASGKTYIFPNYDVLIDAPFEIGNQTVFHFDAAGVDHEVAFYGEGNYDISKLKQDMPKVIAAATAVFNGQNPNKNYTFIVHNVVNGQGGLEHLNSTVLSVNRWSYAGSGYVDFLNLVAHEYFHLWNVKRIRPINLGPFNYDEENYTTMLWVMEGFTSYYDELLLVRAGYMTPAEYVKKLQSTINYVEGSVGSRVQSVAHSSFDAWIKGYRPNENSANTGMTYYSRGAMLGAYLDALIINQTKGKKCLDHFMQTLYADYYLKQNRGFTDAEFQQSLEQFIGMDMDDFFAKYVNGTETPDFNAVFGKLGVGVTYVGKNQASFGASLSQDGGKCSVKSIRSNSSAETGGLSVFDEIISLNGFRIDQSKLEAALAQYKVGDTFELLVSRDEKLLTLTFKMQAYERPAFALEQPASKNNLFDYWLRTE